jgi:hypothetical protein
MKIEELPTPYWNQAKNRCSGRSPGFSDLRFAFPPDNSGSGFVHLGLSCSTQDWNYSCGAASDFPVQDLRSTEFPFHLVGIEDDGGTPEQIMRKNENQIL